METVLPQPGLWFTIPVFIAVIGFLVTIHEFGHYLAGRWFGVKADVFSVGFGKELAGFTDRLGTRWKLSALPLGGYVKFAGDANAASMPGAADHLPPHERARTLNAKPLWQRAVIVAAGPITNFLFAIIVLFGFFILYGQPYTPSLIAGVTAGSPAAAAGLRAGDRIVRLDNSRVDRFEDIQRAMDLSTGRAVAVVFERDGERIERTIMPVMVTSKDEYGNARQLGQLGVMRGERAAARLGPFEAAGAAVAETAEIVQLIPKVIGQIVSGERSVDELGGPLKIGQISGQRAALGVPELVEFMALVSINLGFMNLLPIPVLDGGHLLFYAIEGVRRRPLGQRAQELAFMSGFAALMSFMVFVTWNDLSSFGVWKHLAGLVG